MRLSNAVAGVEYVITTIEAPVPSNLGDLGIYPGARAVVVMRLPFGGPVLLDLYGSQVALDRAIAARVAVRFHRAKSAFKPDMIDVIL